ncbi:STAS domain-containing protein [Isoptericola sediminis]|uniref:STAS domain-containing protein n=1 Tax=Isoptericola sediminis TaxID=2733572 RepID=A0A849K2S3_9MICO|nr:STAS domain-containing protein [Isoptericola sediminis]NNU27071.1 STAS domain-containing protein [Isoptericola sediminis]
MGARHASGGVRVARQGSLWVMWGDIDFSVTHSVRDQLAATLDGRAKTVDLSRVTFMDSSGLHLILMDVTMETRPRLVGTPDAVLDLLEMSGALELVELIDEIPPAEAPERAPRTRFEPPPIVG